MTYNLSRFLSAQERDYSTALSEIKRGRKTSHWMWYIFPQVAGLGFSETSEHYSIKSIDEAHAYLEHPVLGTRLIEISEALLELEEKSAYQIFGSPDDMKLKSSMTLFGAVPGAPNVFGLVLDRYYNGQKDEQTLALLKQ